MKHLLFLISCCLLPPASWAAPATPLFGTQRFTPGRTHTVTGPLVQLQMPDGTTLSFQQGARFMVSPEGIVTLTSGNLRVGPSGATPLILNLPQGPVTLEPLTALTITAGPQKSSGRIYQGNITANDTTFTTGQGFVLTPSGARGTFTPAAAQAPALPLTLASIEPAAGPAKPSPQPITQLPTAPAIQPEQPLPEQPQPETQPTVTEPEPQPPVIEPEPQPEPEPPVTQPNPEPQPPVTEPEPQPEPQPEPEPEPQLPSILPRTDLYASFSEPIPGAPMPDASHATPATFQVAEFPDGSQTLTETATSFFNLSTTRLNIGTALNLDTASHNAIAGLGRWVGGELSVITGPAYAPQETLIPNTTTVTNGEETTTYANSIHYVWGQRPTDIPVSDRIEYTLFSATQPTYTGPVGNTLSSEGATFNGSLAIDFVPPTQGFVGTYHLTGTVTMPQQVDDAPTVYSFTTPSQGIPLNGGHFNSTGTVAVTAPTGAVACPSGCNANVNVAGFGAGMHDAGTLYTINPGADVGITGGALFTSAP